MLMHVSCVCSHPKMARQFGHKFILRLIKYTLRKKREVILGLNINHTYSIVVVVRTIKYVRLLSSQRHTQLVLHIPHALTFVRWLLSV